MDISPRPNTSPSGYQRQAWPLCKTCQNKYTPRHQKNSTGTSGVITMRPSMVSGYRLNKITLPAATASLLNNCSARRHIITLAANNTSEPDSRTHSSDLETKVLAQMK